MSLTSLVTPDPNSPSIRLLILALIQVHPFRVGFFTSPSARGGMESRRQVEESSDSRPDLLTTTQTWTRTLSAATGTYTLEKLTVGEAYNRTRTTSFHGLQKTETATLAEFTTVAIATTTWTQLPTTVTKTLTWTLPSLPSSSFVTLPSSFGHAEMEHRRDVAAMGFSPSLSPTNSFFTAVSTETLTDTKTIFGTTRTWTVARISPTGTILSTETIGHNGTFRTLTHSVVQFATTSLLKGTDTRLPTTQTFTHTKTLLSVIHLSQEPAATPQRREEADSAEVQELEGPDASLSGLLTQTVSHTITVLPTTRTWTHRIVRPTKTIFSTQTLSRGGALKTVPRASVQYSTISLMSGTRTVLPTTETLVYTKTFFSKASLSRKPTASARRRDEAGSESGFPTSPIATGTTTYTWPLPWTTLTIPVTLYDSNTRHTDSGPDHQQPRAPTRDRLVHEQAVALSCNQHLHRVFSPPTPELDSHGGLRNAVKRPVML
jgi:hypothetical protein